MAEQDLSNATQDVLAAALRQTDDEELRIEAACAAGDQIRFGEMGALHDDLRAALAAPIEAAGDWNDLRFECGIALCEAQDPRGARLTETLNNKERRFDACKALSRLRLPEVQSAVSALSKKFFLSWPDKLVASGVCAVLGDKEGARYFEKTLVSRWFGARRAMALHLLGELRHPEAYTVLMSLIDNKNDQARHVAIRALGHLGDKRAVDSLKSIADGEVEEDVRYALNLLVPPVAPS